MTRSYTIMLLTASFLVLLPGCQRPIGAVADLNDRIALLEKDKRELLSSVDAQSRKIAMLQEAVDNFAELGDGRINKLYYVDHIEIDRFSDTTDLDGQPGDDGVIIYLKLYDQEGHEFKAAGEINVGIYDAVDGELRLIGAYNYDVDEAKKQWHGRLWTYHYKLTCPWKNQQPRSREITVRVDFLDYLTGSPHHDTKEFEVTPPAKGDSAPTPPTAKP